MTSPFAAGLGPGGARTLYVLGLIAAVKGLALVGIAEALARGISTLFAGSTDVTGAVQLGVLSVVARSVAAWVAEWFAVRASIGAKESLRADLVDRLLDEPAALTGAATTLATRGLDDLDPYYRTVLPSVMSAAVIPLLVGVRILTADWLAAVIVLLTVPLIPVFMILIGQHTRDRVDEASGALARLADHLVELARGLPVLVGLGRVGEQAEALHAISEDHRRRTMGTLRTAFLSALALELIATISVALVAVTVGVRLVGGDMTLYVGLLVLILAPECYAPLREVGTAFHASEDGASALRRAREILRRRPPTSDGSGTAGEGIALDVPAGTLRFGGEESTGIKVPALRVAAGETVAIIGPSGAGKSTVLRALAGRTGAGWVSAPDSAIRVASPIAWLPQHPMTIGDTVHDEMLRWADPEVARATTEARIADVLGRLRLGGLAQAVPASLSPGELRRLAVARTVLRVDAGAAVALFDEPTAHLDDDSARAVTAMLDELRGRVAMVLVSHDERVLQLADRTVAVGHDVVGHDVVVAGPASSTITRGEPTDSTVPAAREPAPARAKSSTPALGASGVRTVLLGILRPIGGRLIGAIVLGALAALSAAALTAVSGWLIVRAAEQPPIMYLLVAIVGVRFFGLMRSVLRYAERLVTHSAVFASTGELRRRMWLAVAERGTASPALRTSGAALDTLVITADRIRDLVPRVVVPPLVGLATGTAALIAVGFLHAPAVPALAVGLVVALIVAPAVAYAADRQAGAAGGEVRSQTARRLAALLDAADDLRGNGVDGLARAELAALDALAGTLARRAAVASGVAGALVTAALAGSAVVMLALAAPAVAAGQLSVEVVAVLTLLPLGLIDPAIAVVDAVQRTPELVAAVRRIEPVLDRPRPHASRRRTREAPSLRGFSVRDLSVRWPDAQRPAFSHLDAEADRERWLAVTGPSGSGKSTLISTLLGYLDPADGRYALETSHGEEIDSTTLAGAGLRRRMAWCPQEAHVFASTVRGNLLLARPRDDRPSDEEMWSALDAVGLGRSVLGEGRHGLDTWLGHAGSELSGGESQRLAVARALLARADMVLLDEPTAHLDADTADHMMRDLRAALSARVVVLVTHNRTDIAEEDRVVELGAVPARV